MMTNSKFSFNGALIILMLLCVTTYTKSDEEILQEAKTLIPEEYKALITYLG